MTRIGLDYVRFKEDQRKNLVDEGIKRDTLDETIRTNKENESIKHLSLEEQIRANKEKEKENHRTNVANEAIKQGELAEKHRSNVRNEELKAEQNAENKRSNMSDERIKIMSEELDNVSSSEAETMVKSTYYDQNTGQWYPSHSTQYGDGFWGDAGALSSSVFGNLYDTAREFLTRQKVKI